MLILRARKVELFYLQKWSEDWNRIYCFVASVCVQVCLSEVKKILSDSEPWLLSEQSSFANLSRISDEDVMEEDLEDVEEFLTYKLT